MDAFNPNIETIEKISKIVKDNELFINESYTISLTDIHGNVLAGMDIIIKLGDKVRNKVSDEFGNVSISASDLNSFD